VSVDVYSVGLCYASACATTDVPREEVERAVQRSHPSGVAPWKVADELFRTGEPNPCPCNSDEGKQHWLLVC
jgi:hypothetical protein